jgi:hypothetical protein
MKGRFNVSKLSEKNVWGYVEFKLKIESDIITIVIVLVRGIKLTLYKPAHYKFDK